MDPLVQMIVDFLRRGKENDALNQGGPTAGAGGVPGVTPLMPQAQQPKHGGRPINDIIEEMSR